MNVCKVAGYGDYSFTDDRGQLVSGRKYHLILLPSRDTHTGYEVSSQSVSTAAMNVWKASGAYVPSVGDVCVISYNRFGRIDSFGALKDLDNNPFSDLS